MKETTPIFPLSFESTEGIRLGADGSHLQVFQGIEFEAV